MRFVQSTMARGKPVWEEPGGWRRGMMRARVVESIACVGLLAGLAVLWGWEERRPPQPAKASVRTERADGGFIKRDPKTGEVLAMGGPLRFSGGSSFFGDGEEPQSLRSSLIRFESVGGDVPLRVRVSARSSTSVFDLSEDTATVMLSVTELEMSSDMTSAAQTFDSQQEGFRLLLNFPGLGVREFCWSGGAWREEPPPAPCDPFPVYIRVSNVTDPALAGLESEWER